MSTKAEKDAAAKAAKAEKDAADNVESVSAVKYSKADQRKVKELTDAGVTLEGTESPDELDTLIAALPAEGADEHAAEQIIPGVPNKLPIKHEVIVLANKKYNFPIFYMAVVKGGQAMYDYHGRRVSPVYGPDDVLAGSEGSSPTKALNYTIKACAKFNAQRRKSVLPGDAELGAGANVN